LSRGGREGVKRLSKRRGGGRGFNLEY